MWVEAHKHVAIDVLQPASVSTDVEQPLASSLPSVAEQSGAPSLFARCYHKICCVSYVQTCCGQCMLHQVCVVTVCC